jgi:hypothetical protein
VNARYRLIEIDVADLEDTRHFPFEWRPTRAIERLRAGEETPPIVVVQTDRGHGFGIIDGLNRAYAYWIEGHSRIRPTSFFSGDIPEHWPTQGLTPSRKPARSFLGCNLRA